MDLDIVNSLAVASVAMRRLTSPEKSLFLTGVSNKIGLDRDSANLKVNRINEFLFRSNGKSAVQLCYLTLLNVKRNARAYHIEF